MVKMTTRTPTGDYDLTTELAAVANLLQRRGVPPKDAGNLLIATWNIEHLGSRRRSEKDYRLIAELIRPFDITAIQEVKSRLSGLKAVLRHLGSPFRTVFTDVAGNAERLAYIYDSSRVQTKELYGELAIPESERKNYDPPDIRRRFRGFNRNPFMVSFQRATFDFTLVNAHVYFGKESGVEYLKRLVEVYALAKWAKKQVKSRNAYERDVVLIGDLNVPEMDEADEVYKQLTRFGYKATEHRSRVGATDREGTNLPGTKHYDQIAIHPKRTRRPTDSGILNFDKHLFRSIWDRHNFDPKSDADLAAWGRYCERRLSDHRPFWASFSA